MQQIPLFTKREALVHNMEVLFSMGLDGFRERPQPIFCNPSFIQHFRLRRLPHLANAVLHSYRDNGSGKPLSSYIHGALVFCPLNNFPVTFLGGSRLPESNVVACSTLQMAGGCRDHGDIYCPQHGRQ